MSVSLTVSKTLGGTGIADTLAGGSSGLDLGSCTNGSYTPLTLQSANSGAQDIFVKHNATVDPITAVKTYVAVFSGVYGGADTAANDYTTLKAQGAASANTTANNNNGTESGLRVDMDWQVSTANQFTPSRTTVFTYGLGGAGSNGIDLASAFIWKAAGVSRNNSGTEVAASAAVDGKIGKSGDTVLGDTGHLKKRYYLPTSALNGGILQWDYTIAFSYTA